MAFPDLRIQRVGMREEGFWPSFTDIMMVIVMIFLMAMLGLLLRNMDLVAKLQQALIEAQQASQQIEQTSSANHDLSSRLAQSEHDLEMMRAQLMDVSRERKRLDQQWAQSKAQASAAQEQVALLQRAYQQLQGEQRQQQEQEERLRQQLQQSKQAAAEQAKLADAQLQQARQRLQQQGLDLVRLQASLDEQRSQSKLVRDSYTELEARYRRLLRPARSSLGKVVVTVRYQRRDHQLKVAIKPPDAASFTAVESVQLHQMLSQLKAKFGKKLYVRILFPEDSGLSYSEAWRITESLLRLYDYYYQE